MKIILIVISISLFSASAFSLSCANMFNDSISLHESFTAKALNLNNTLKENRYFSQDECRAISQTLQELFESSKSISEKYDNLIASKVCSDGFSSTSFFNNLVLLNTTEVLNLAKFQIFPKRCLHL